MGVMLQAAIRFKPGHTVPSPYDGDPSVPWWWDHIASQVNSFRQAGFTAVLLPPATKSNAGAFVGADGYGAYDDYDIGSKNQFYSVPTRFGRREQLQRCTAIMRANGLDVYADFVAHQRMGGNNGIYRYLGADGKTKNGRFPKDPGCFLGDSGGRVPRDPIAGPVEFDYAFGDELCPVNAVPKDYVMNGLIDAGDWLTRSLDLQGYRIDDTKGLAVEFVSTFLNSKSMHNKFAVGEYFDGNPDTLNWWVYHSGMNGRSATFDFQTHFALYDMCNNTSKWDMRRLQGSGYFRRDPSAAVTFVENMDTDTDGFSSVIWNKILGYAYILTNEGYPCVYYRDYATDPGCYGLKSLIDNLIWIHEHLASGHTVSRYADFQSYVYERIGGTGLLVGLHNDRWNGWKTVRVQTSFGSNVQLHDYTGNASDVWTDNWGWVTIALPPNNNGTGYVCYSRIMQNAPNLVHTHETNQMFEGADDLDIPSANNATSVNVCRIWCQAGTKLILRSVFDRTNFTTDSSMVMIVVDPGQTIFHESQSNELIATVITSGWHQISITGTALPDTGTLPYKIYTTYTSTHNLNEKDFVSYMDTPVKKPVTPLSSSIKR